jgi:hypothetical protein
MSLTILEHPSASYMPRTVRNAKAADLTVAFAVDFTTAGEKLTKKEAGHKYLAILPTVSDPASAIVEWLQERYNGRAVEINVAGNGIYTMAKYGLTQEMVNKAITDVFRTVSKHYPIYAIRSGGQTGADIAGAVAGVVIGVPTQVLMPRGFRQRNVHGEDILLSEEAVRRQILNYAAQLV